LCTATTLIDIFYIAQKHTRSIEQARQAVAEILTVMTICPVDRAVLESAFNSGLTDFEDAVQIFCAVTQGLDAILTRDKRGFVSSPVPVLSIGELLQQLRSKSSD
jgi:predicted nucleic acid-binding protein